MILVSDDFPCQQKLSKMRQQMSKFTIDTAQIKQTLESEISETKNRVDLLEQKLSDRNKTIAEAESALERQKILLETNALDWSKVVAEKQ